MRTFRIFIIIVLSLCLLPASVALAQQKTRLQLRGQVRDNKGQPVELAHVVLNRAFGTYTKADGSFTLTNLPGGTYQWEVTCVGYETAKGTTEVKEGAKRLTITLQERSLGLNEVTVVAKQTQMGSISEIGQDAIRHLQPKSVGDMLQLMPGSLTENPSLNNLSQVKIREIDGDYNNSLGASVIVDGMQLSNDGNLQTLSATRFGTNSSQNVDGMSNQTTAGRGIDLRTLSAGTVESIKVIRGIPGVEYGNLTSGVVIVETKSGRTPWEAKVSADPFSKLVFAGKGFALKNGGAINLGADWAQSWSDVRKHYLGYDRITASAGYSDQWGPVSMNVRGAFYSNVNNRKDDPQMEEMEVLLFKNKNVGGRASVTGDWKIGASWIDKLDYALSAQYAHSVDEHKDRIYSPDGAVTNVRESGIHVARFLRDAYWSEYNIDGRPYRATATLKGSKYLQMNQQNHMNLNIGAEYTVDGNHGAGLRYDETYPPQGTAQHTLRPRAYDDIPALQTLSAWASDRVSLKVGTVGIVVEGGVRLSNLFLDKAKSGGARNKFVAEPRINTSLSLLNKKNQKVFDDLSLTGGFGISNKMPTLLYLYPDRSYYDFPSLTKWGATEADRLALITTRVIEDTQNPDLRPINTRKWEMGLSFRIGQFNGFLTYFNERHRHEFGFDPEMFIMTYPQYQVPATATNPVFDPATQSVSYTDDNGLRQVADINYRTYFYSWGRPSNNSRSNKHGIEYGIDLGEWRALRTSLNVSGAWFHITRKSETIGLSSLEPEYPYLAIMPSGGGSVRDRVNTTFRFVTHIPAIKMVFTTTAQVVWYDSQRMTYQDDSGRERRYLYSYKEANGEYRDYWAVDPIGYYDKQGNRYDWTAADAADSQKSRMISRYQLYAYERDVISPWVLLSFRFTKELGKIGELSFIANNFPNMKHFHTNKHSLSKTQVYPDLYFGAELKLKL